MTEQKSELELKDDITFERIVVAGDGWRAASRLIHPLEVETFGDQAFNLDEVEDSLQQPKTVLVIAKDGGKLVGFTYAVPVSYTKVEMIDIEREDGGKETAYIYDTVVSADHRGKKITPRMMDLLLPALQKEGFRFVERDTAVDSGYADQVQRHYEQRDLMIKAGPEHTSQWGTQRFMRMKIPTPLRVQNEI